MTSIVIGFEVENNKPVKINLDDIVEDRALITANSRGGKSYIVRKFLEESNGKVQQIVIDPEGEYKTLREKYDYLLVGSKSEGAEIQVSLKIAELLPIKLLELGVSAIIDLYELKSHERIRFVRLFLEAMVNVKKELWHSCMVILDEAHVFAPEKGSKTGITESLDSVKDLASRGGKRGFALIACTQRLAKLSKDVTTELNNKFIGRAGDYDDQVRAVKELGLKSSDVSLFGDLKYEFFVRGNAVSDKVIRIKAYEVKTTHKSGGKQLHVVIPTPEKIRSIALSLKDIPEEAEKENRTKEELQIQNNHLKAEIRRLESNRPRTQVEDPLKNQVELTKAFNDGVKATETYYQVKLKDLKYRYDKLVTNLKKIPVLADQITTASLIVDGIDFNIERTLIEKHLPDRTTSGIRISNEFHRTVLDEKPAIDSDVKLRDGAIRMLKSLAQFYPNNISKGKLRVLSGIQSYGTFMNYLSDLKKTGWMKESGDGYIITDDGYKNAGSVEALSLDSDALLSFWSSKFRDGAGRILKELFDTNPNSISRSDLQQMVNIASYGTFMNYLSDLKKCGLIEVNGSDIKISSEFFH